MVTGVVPHVGGPILPPGHPTTMIGYLPAARVGDLVTCVGPPDTIIRGSPTVLIGNMPAARMGDNTAHGGVIMLGHPTTMIGDAGSGGGGGGGGGAGGAAAAAGSAAAAAASGAGGPPAAVMNPRPAEIAEVGQDQDGPLEPAEDEEQVPTWIGILLEDFTGRPMPNQQFQITLDGGQVLSGTTDAEGYARIEDLEPDQGEVAFTEIPEHGETATQEEQQQGQSQSEDAPGGPATGSAPEQDWGDIQPENG
jgi:uncharacterized Zn-binding protein involved in type VI secretion